MNKVLLVIDMPLSIDCEDLERYEAELKIIDNYEDDHVLSKHHLSLKPMPQKEEIDENYKFTRWDDDCDMAYSCGYNNCLEEILEGE